jgi:O-antigen/teichoic acid export membrane protein
MRARLSSILSALNGAGDENTARRNAILAFLIRVGSAGLAYLSQIILARWMGSYEYGIFAYVWVWLLLLGGLSTLGLNTAVIRFIPEYTEKADLSRLRGIIFQSRLVTLVTSTALMCVALLLLYLLKDHVESYVFLPGLIVLICLPAYALTDLHDSMARGYSWMNLALIPPFLLRPLLILATMACLWFAGMPLTAVTAISAAVLATWLTALIQLIFLEPRIRREVPKGTHQTDTRFWLITAFPILLMESFVLFLQNTDVLVLSIYHPPEDVAKYYAALKTINLITFVHFAVSNAVANRFSAYEARGDKALLASIIRQSVKWTFWPSLAAALALLLVGKPLLWLFGPEFTSAYHVMVILSVGLVIKAMFGPAEYVLNMLGEQKLCAAVLFFTAMLNLLLNFMLVPVWGLAGAAVATSTSLTTAALLFFLAIRLRLNINIFAFSRQA